MNARSGNGLAERLLSMLLCIVMCAGLAPASAVAEGEGPLELSHFTVDTVKAIIPDAGFATAIYNGIADAIDEDLYWDDLEAKYGEEYMGDGFLQTLAVDEIIAEIDAKDESIEEKAAELTAALLRNYTGTVEAAGYGITDITGWEYLINTEAVDLSNNNITDISGFTGTMTRAGYCFYGNAIASWPATLPDILGDGEHLFDDTYSVGEPIVERVHEEGHDSASVTLDFGVSVGGEAYADWQAVDASYVTLVADPTKAGLMISSGKESLDPSIMEGKSSTAITGVTQSSTYSIAGSLNEITYTNGILSVDDRMEQAITPTYDYTVKFDFMGKLDVIDATVKYNGFLFEKTSEASGEPVPGAKYKLYRYEAETDMWELVDDTVYKTDDEGQFSRGGLLAGEYRLMETEPANGYYLNPDAISFTIEDPNMNVSAKGGSYPLWNPILIDPIDGTLTPVWSADGNTYEKGQLGTEIETNGSTIDALIQNYRDRLYNALDSVNARCDSPDYSSADASVKLVMDGVEQTVTHPDGTPATGADIISNNVVRDYINSALYTNKLGGNVTVTLSGTYIQNPDSYMGVDGKDAPLPVNLTISADKTLTGGTVAAEGKSSFRFELSAVDEDGVKTSVETVTVTPDAEQGTDGGGVATFKTLSFSKAGAYTYIVSETVPAKGDDTYSASIDYNPKGTIHTVTVTVTEDEAEGGLSATVTVDGKEQEDTFTATGTNTIKIHEEDDGTKTYTVTAKSASISAGTITNVETAAAAATRKVTGTKTLTGGKTASDIEAEAFGFTVTRTDENTGSVTCVPAGTVYAEAGTGALDFGTWNFGDAGIYSFRVSENTAPEDYTRAEDILMTVDVIMDGGSNKLVINSVVYSGGNTGLNFENVYAPTGTGTDPGSEATYTVPSVTKSMTGSVIPSGTTREFTMTIAAKSTSVVGMTTENMPQPEKSSVKRTVTGNGTATPDISSTDDFGDIKFMTEGTYVYTVTETANNGEGFICDSTSYTLSVEVSRGNAGLAASGKISDGTSASTVFSFSNQYQTQETLDVTVNKVWAGDEDPNRPASIEVQLLRDGAAYGGATALTKAGGWTHTWTALESGHTWTVKEITALGNYTTKVTGDSANGFVITNTYSAPKGQLTVTKTVTGGGSTGALFTFTFTFSEAGPFAYTLGNTTGTIRSGGTLQLRHGESATVTIPQGVTYTVVESAYNNYDPAPASRTISGTITKTASTAAFINRYDESCVPGEPTGSLTVKKTVTGDNGDRSKYFTFTVTFSAPGSYTYMGSASGTIRSGDSVLLKHGEYITILGLPAGTIYGVSESGNSGYMAYAVGDAGVIPANGTAVAAFTNSMSYVPQTGDDNSLQAGILLTLSGLLGTTMLLSVNMKIRRKRRGAKAPK